MTSWGAEEDAPIIIKMEAQEVIDLIKACNEGDTIIWDQANGEVYKIKVMKKYPKGWKPRK